MNIDETEHSRFDEEHYRNCQDCYEDHLDFMQEMEMEARMDEYNNEGEMMSSRDDRIAELEDEVKDLTTELEYAKEEIDVLQDEVDSFEDRYDEGYQEGYEKALENAINAVEELK